MASVLCTVAIITATLVGLPSGQTSDDQAAVDPARVIRYEEPQRVIRSGHYYERRERSLGQTRFFAILNAPPSYDGASFSRTSSRSRSLSFVQPAVDIRDLSKGDAEARWWLHRWLSADAYNLLSFCLFFGVIPLSLLASPFFINEGLGLGYQPRTVNWTTGLLFGLYVAVGLGMAWVALAPRSGPSPGQREALSIEPLIDYTVPSNYGLRVTAIRLVVANGLDKEVELHVDGEMAARLPTRASTLLRSDPFAHQFSQRRRRDDGAVWYRLDIYDAQTNGLIESAEIALLPGNRMGSDVEPVERGGYYALRGLFGQARFETRAIRFAFDDQVVGVAGEAVDGGLGR